MASRGQQKQDNTVGMTCEMINEEERLGRAYQRASSARTALLCQRPDDGGGSLYE